MTDNEKERELSGEGKEMNEKTVNELELGKESSLAADQESVNKTQDLSNNNNSPQKSDDSSRELNDQKDIENETSGEETALEKKAALGETAQESPNPANQNDLSNIEVSEDQHSINEDESPVPDKKANPDANMAARDVETSSDQDSDKHLEESPPEEIEQNKVSSELLASDDHTQSVSISDKVDSSSAKEEDPSTGESNSNVTHNQPEEDDNSEHSDEDEFDEEIDYSQLTKDDLIRAFENILHIEDLKAMEKKIRDIKPFYDDIVETERSAALEKFLEEGGSEIDFQYAGDALDARFHALYEKYKTRKNTYYQELEKNKEENLDKKQEVLEKLREIVDGEETNASISALKNIQKEWRSIGPVPASHAKSLWATYNILIDRFYDNRSIYFELKELDRKKNLEAKLELCEKAEQLLDYEVIRDAVKELNELHEEFKHVGPVPAEMQDAVWHRFKSASDAIYERRKNYVSSLKKELHENLELKNQLVGEVSKFEDFDSDKITEWNDKTKEILETQKKWESIGGLPREYAKEVNKNFWSSFKNFFNNKNKFFKKLENQRDENLIKKEEIVKRAEALKNSSEWEKTADTLKALQQEWKDIGPVPEKNRNEIYRRFKNACDIFFNRRREHSRDIESEYKVNLRRKEEICQEIENMAKEKNKNIDRFKELQSEYNALGYVPRNAIKKILKKYNQANELFLSSLQLSDAEKSELRFAVEVDKLKSGPNANKRIQKKEIEVRRLIGKIENDIALWKNNIEFFADSKTADKVKEEFKDKIKQATAQLIELREELKVLNKI